MATPRPPHPEPLTLPDGRSLTFECTRVMGILNVTPDSFSDGGQHHTLAAAVDHGLRLLAEGADVIDVGGESTRPGASRIAADEQIARTRDVIAELTRQAPRRGLPQPIISIDTTLAPVARAALDAGASIINDVAAGLEDADLLALAAGRGAPVVLMHMRGQPATMQSDPRYNDVVAEVRQFLLQRAHAAEQAGIARSQIVLDPGIGFGKTRTHNLQLLASLDQLTNTGYPVLLGASRKRFMRDLAYGVVQTPTGGWQRADPQPADLIGGTCATTVLAHDAGVAMVRVHDVAANRHALAVAHAASATRLPGL